MKDSAEFEINQPLPTNVNAVASVIDKLHQYHILITIEYGENVI